MELHRLSAFFLVILLGFTHGFEYCNKWCDGMDPGLSEGPPRIAVFNTTIDFRVITLSFSDEDNMGFATIRDGSEGDNVWLDRSFDGGLTWEESGGSMLGRSYIPAGLSMTSTNLYNVDWDFNSRLGALRACGKSRDGPIACTPWARSTVLATTPNEAAATALMQFYDGALFHTVGWWNSANALTALINYMRLSGSRSYFPVIESSYINNLDGWDGNFTSDALDDTEWWALAWIEAYDLTGEQKYLDMAIFDYEYIHGYVDDVCGGGVWWNIYRTYKNAITNELLIQIAAALHNRIPGDTRYLAEAIELWDWFRGSGMINGQNFINDGLNDDCQNNGQTTWTYNQGVILGALVELYRGTGDQIYLYQATVLADAVTTSPTMSPNGVLKEPCERSGWSTMCGVPPDGCDCNQISFKGIYMRHIGELNRVLPGSPYTEWIQRQGQSNYDSNRNPLNQYGIFYAGPFENHNAGTQQSALEAFTAAIV